MDAVDEEIVDEFAGLRAADLEGGVGGVAGEGVVDGGDTGWYEHGRSAGREGRGCCGGARGEEGFGGEEGEVGMDFGDFVDAGGGLGGGRGGGADRGAGLDGGG